MKTIFSLFLALTIVTHTATAGQQNHVVHNVAVVHASDVANDHLQEMRARSRPIQHLTQPKGDAHSKDS